MTEKYITEVFKQFECGKEATREYYSVVGRDLDSLVKFYGNTELKFYRLNTMKEGEIYMDFTGTTRCDSEMTVRVFLEGNKGIFKADSVRKMKDLNNIMEVYVSRNGENVAIYWHDFYDSDAYRETA